MASEDIEKPIENIVKDLGYALWACEYIPQGRHTLLRIYIDTAEGIGIKDCERVSREVSAYLDVEEPIKGNYSLEVSSPGIPRPLFSLAHYEKYLQCTVEVKLMKPINNRRKISGVIETINENGDITILSEDIALVIPFSLIVKAYLIDE